MFACTWSLGASLDSKSRKHFNILFKELMAEGLSLENKRRYKILVMVDAPKKAMGCPYPEEGNVFEYKFVNEGNGLWVRWDDELKGVAPIPADAEFSSIIVPTVNTIRYTALMKMLLDHCKPSLFVGPTGTGKSIYISVSN